MGRYVFELATGTDVWKYWFAIQNSNQYLINEYMGIGTLSGIKYVQDKLRVWHVLDVTDPEWEDEGCDFGDPDCAGDILNLSQSDVPVMRQWLIDNTPTAEQRAIEKAIGNTFDFTKDEHAREAMQYIAFWQMVQTYADLMDKNPTIEDFAFSGEY